MRPAFRVQCLSCKRHFATTTKIFEDIDWRPIDDPDRRYEMKLRIPTPRSLLAMAMASEESATKALNPIEGSTLPVVPLVCPYCKEEVPIALGIFNPPAGMARHGGLVGQAQISETAPDGVQVESAPVAQPDGVAAPNMFTRTKDPE